MNEMAADQAAHRQGGEREDEHAKRKAAQRHRLKATRLRCERPENLQRAEGDEEQGEDLAGSDHGVSARPSERNLHPAASLRQPAVKLAGSDKKQRGRRIPPCDKASVRQSTDHELAEIQRRRYKGTAAANQFAIAGSP
jgi:hypothetical protein